MRLKVTPAIKALLGQAAEDGRLPPDVREQAAVHAVAESLEWATLKAVTSAVRQQQQQQQAVPLHEMCRGGALVLDPPPARTGKSPELRAHLEVLRRRLEQQRYDAMVHDVTTEERRVAALMEGGFSTYRQQISFGVHVIVMMGAFYAFGHVAATGLTSSRTKQALSGLACMIFAMLLETTLYIIRTSVRPRLHEEAAMKAQRARIEQTQERTRAELAAAAGQQAGGSSSSSSGRQQGGGSSSSGGGGWQQGQLESPPILAAVAQQPKEQQVKKDD